MTVVTVRYAGPRTMWTIFTRNGERATLTAYYSVESAERTLEYWRERELKGIRTDVKTEGHYVGRVQEANGAE